MSEPQQKSSIKASDLIIGLLALLLMLPIFAVPTQAAFEVIYWLREASWLNYDWYMLTGYNAEEIDLGPDLKGMTTLVRWLMDSWVSIPFSVVAGGIFRAIVH